MTPLRRWGVVAVVAAIVVAVPWAWQARPVAESDVGAAELLTRIQGSADRPYQGYVETRGTLRLPVGDGLGDLARLVGEPSRLRVWWRDPQAWRVDRLRTTGETDLVHTDGVTTEFDYERARAVRSRDPEIRLPRTADLVPPSLARTALEGADPREVSRLPSRRVAGVAAPGLRLTPASPVSRIARVDVWVDPATGLALRVEVVADGETRPALITTFQSFSATEPDPGVLDFRPGPDVEVSVEPAVDIAEAAARYAPFVVPDRIGGLERTTSGGQAAGVYGTGATRVIAVPLRGREADPLREALRASPGATVTPDGTAAGVGPLGVFLTGEDGEFGWLVAGTLTASALADAAGDVRDRAVFVGDAR